MFEALESLPVEGLAKMGCMGYERYWDDEICLAKFREFKGNMGKVVIHGMAEVF